jgi:hypothetical protein
MKNVTITLDEAVARWVRIRAAERETSVSRLVGEMLREEMEAERSYLAAMERYLSRPARLINESGAPYPGREAVHERPDLR